MDVNRHEVTSCSLRCDRGLQKETLGERQVLPRPGHSDKYRLRTGRGLFPGRCCGESSPRALGKSAPSLPGRPPLGPAARGPRAPLRPGAAAARSRRCGRNARLPRPQPGPAPPPRVPRRRPEPPRGRGGTAPPSGPRERRRRAGRREARPRQPAGE